MSCERRRARGRTIILAVSACAFALLAPTTAAQSSAQIILPDAAPAPGAAFVVTFRVPGGPVDVGVQDHVSCLLVDAEGEVSVCDWRGELVTLRVMPASVDYVLPIVAPAVAGDHTLRISRAPIADTQLFAVSAEATLSVVAPDVEEELQPGGGPGPAGADGEDAPGPGPAGTTTNIWNIFLGRDPGAPKDPDAGGDAARWMVSSTFGSAALLALVVAGRKGGAP